MPAQKPLNSSSQSPLRASSFDNIYSKYHTKQVKILEFINLLKLKINFKYWVIREMMA